MKYDLFISYSRKDFDEVSSLLETIKTAIPNLSYWFDIDGIESGDEFEDKIISAIDNSSYVLFALSENSIQSQWTKDEVMYAKNTDKKVIPVLLKGAQMKGWFLFKFGRIDCIDSTNTLQIEKLLQNLSDWTGKDCVDFSAESVVERTSEQLCPCGSGKLFKDCHGKHAVVPESYASKPTGPVSDLTKASPAAYDDIISKISNILKSFKINVLSITADIRSTGVMYRIVPGSGIRPAAIANLHREIAFALGVCEAIVIEYSDGTVALTLKDYDSPVERTWKVGDYYDVGGKKGVVFWVDETGKHGKIVSLDQAEKQWCTDDEYRKGLTGIASDEYDGMKNLQSIQKISDWRNKYPAFAWCADHGDGWYLPAIKELELLLLNEEVHDAVNNQIARKGKAKLFSKGEFKIYWSSTEQREWCAWGVYMYGGGTIFDARYSSTCVRAVSAF